MKAIAFLFLVVALFGAVASTRDEPRDPVVEAYRGLVAQDLRLATVGYHLAKGSAEYCRNTWRNPGWVLHDLRQYPDADLAQRAFTFREPVSIAALVADGPAIRAGLSVGDGLAGFGGSEIWYGGEPVKKRATSERLDNVRDQVGGALAGDGLFRALVTTDAGRKTIAFDPPRVCASDFWVDVRSKRDAGADGKRVRVTSGLIEYVADDDELAAVVAHEMAHNLLDHRSRIERTKSGKTAVIKSTEEEADRLSIWLMANAGYDPEAAISFWQRYGKATSLGIFSAPTHYRWQDRVRMFREEIERMASHAVKNGRRDPPLLAEHRSIK